MVLKQILDSLNIQSKTLAEYLALKPSNFSSLIKGERKINIEMAIKLGNIFSISPDIWISIQLKNELMNIKNQKSEEFKKYKLEDLVKLK